MVLLATPLHDIACPVVFIEHSASLPDFLGDAIAEIGEHYERTLLPDFSLYKYTASASNLEDEVKALASSEVTAKYSINFAGDLVRTLAELPAPRKALAHHLKTGVNSKKPVELKKQDPVFKSLLPSRRLNTLELAEKNGTAFILSEPIIVSTEGSFSGDKKDGLVKALVADLGIHTQSTPSLFVINDKEKKSVLSKLRFRPRAFSLPSSPRPFPTALQLLFGDKQAATKLLPPCRAFLSGSILIEKRNSILVKENSSSLPHAFSKTLLEQYSREERRNFLPLFPSAASQLRQMLLANDSNALKYALKPERRPEIKFEVSITRKLPAILLSTADAAAIASSAPWVQNKKRRRLLAEAETTHTIEKREEDILEMIEVPLLPEHLKAATAATTSTAALFPLAAFPELLQPPPGATDLALGFSIKNTTTTNNPTTTITTTANTATVEDMHSLRITERGNSIQNFQACSLLWDLVAKEMAPADNFSLLSPIALPESGITTALHALCVSPYNDTVGRDSSSPVVVGLFDETLQEGGVMKHTTGSLALVLDWSLSTQQASLRNTELLDTCKRVKDSMAICVKKKNVTLESGSSSTATIAKAVLSSLLAPFSLDNLECKSEISLITSPSSFDSSIAATALGDGTLAATPCTNNNINKKKFTRPAAGAPPSATAEEADDVPPVKRLRLEHDGSTAVPPAAPGALGFFMQLYNKNGSDNGVHGAVAAAAVKGNGKGIKSTSIENTSTSSMSDGLSNFLQPVNSLQTITTTLPSRHADLLLYLQSADAALLATVPPQFMPPGVTRQDFPDLEHVNTALHSINASNDSISAAGKKPVLRMLAGVAIFRQTAKLVIHHGIRSAHMYFSSSIQELPGICTENNNSSTNLAQVLAEAADKVESGQEEDHPKHTALRQRLMIINTLALGSKILIVGDPKSFFTLYSVIHVAGLRPCHLDREGQLLSNTNDDATSSLEREKVAVFGEALLHACTVADCILAAAKLVIKALSSVQTREILLNSFQHVIIYGSEPCEQRKVQEALQLPAGTAAAAAVASTMPPACSITVLSVHVEPLEISPKVEEEQSPFSIPFKQQILADPVAAAAPEITLKAAVPAAPTPDWPLVLSNSTLRPVKSCREVYESIISLENEGASIVERSMKHLDMVLSPSAALIILSEEAIAATATTSTAPAPAGGSGPDFELFVQHVTPMFERIGRAFSKLHLVCEGGAAFRAQLLCGNPRLVSAATRCNLTLQCDVTSDATTTSLIARSISASYLQEWKKRSLRSGGQNLFYSIGDPPSQFELFLATTPSLNPHSAAVLAGCGLTLQQLLSLDTLVSTCGGGKVPAVLGLVPTHSMELFTECCSAGRVLGDGDGGEVLLAGAAATVPKQTLKTPMPMLALGAPHDDPPTLVHHQPGAANIVVDDLPVSLNEFIDPPAVDPFPSASSGDNGGFSSPGNGSADLMPAPSWCGPQLGTTHYSKYISVQQHHANFEDGQESQHEHSSHPSLMHQHQHPVMYQNEQLDEFGVPLDPEASWAALGTDEKDQAEYGHHAIHHHHQQRQQQQQGYGYGYGDNGAVNYHLVNEHEAVSGYAPPPWIERGMPLPGLAPTTRMQAPPPRQAPHLFNRYHQQQPPRSESVHDHRISGLSSFQYQQNPQQQPRPFASLVPSQSFRSGIAAGAAAATAARGYTAAALIRQQHQHSTSMWQALSTTTGNTSITTTGTTTGTGTGLSGVEYRNRKWGGGGRGPRRGGGRGGGKGRKFSSRTQRQW